MVDGQLGANVAKLVAVDIGQELVLTHDQLMEEVAVLEILFRIAIHTLAFGCRP